ncbi:CPBP family intramembrane glutamic endopeptidase [Roseinatronobacter sp. S2]|uniref:CPBP family intramembrane glutamic endopeptidase n=1 Tax=Roseinatronobacter sp. S2 TaxID=3035471 RepID=UPI00240EC482|nr:CPBP family intramembrane glutamic endopeptidase [Roseinatronobacter sp. S2]WFE76958.1 CPBP family intramembrane metalloprotease [Roseinatronobacter sp. S2]
MTDRIPPHPPYAGLHWHHAALPIAIVMIATASAAIISGAAAVFAQMQMALLISGIILLLWAPFAALALARHHWVGTAALGIVAALFALNLVSLTLPRVGVFAGFDWNWQGKTLDLIWCLALIALLSRDQRCEIGWTWRTRPGTLGEAFLNIGILVVAGYLLAGNWSPAAYDAERVSSLTLERILFDTTHPNLVEEIVFRGFMLALLDRAFPPRWTIWRAQVGWGLVLTTILFGLVHGVSVSPDGALVFDPVWLFASAVMGFVIGWVRALTGSLWPAFLAHCAPETGILLGMWLR